MVHYLNKKTAMAARSAPVKDGIIPYITARGTTPKEVLEKFTQDTPAIAYADNATKACHTVLTLATRGLDNGMSHLYNSSKDDWEKLLTAITIAASPYVKNGILRYISSRGTTATDVLARFTTDVSSDKFMVRDILALRVFLTVAAQGHDSELGKFEEDFPKGYKALIGFVSDCAGQGQKESSEEVMALVMTLDANKKSFWHKVKNPLQQNDAPTTAMIEDYLNETLLILTHIFAHLLMFHNLSMNYAWQDRYVFPYLRANDEAANRIQSFLNASYLPETIESKLKDAVKVYMTHIEKNLVWRMGTCIDGERDEKIAFGIENSPLDTDFHHFATVDKNAPAILYQWVTGKPPPSA